MFCKLVRSINVLVAIKKNTIKVFLSITSFLQFFLSFFLFDTKFID